MTEPAYWCRIAVDGTPRLGKVEGENIALHTGDLFDAPQPTGEQLPRAQARWLPPVQPRQFLGLWNNFHQRQQLENTRIPDFPLFFVKLAAALAAHEAPIRRPPGFVGRLKFEAELGIVIGRESFQLTHDDADSAIFGYTCVNDVTAPEPLFANDEFPQWCRAKSFPGFGPIGPLIASGIDPADLRVKALLDGQLLQDYPVSDMIFSPAEIVRRLSQEIVLFPGDVVACGTSVGAADMHAGQTIEIEISRIGTLRNRIC